MERTSADCRGVGAAAALAVGLATTRGKALTPTAGAAIGHGHGDDSGKLLFFASDGLRQDAVEQYADDGARRASGTCCATARGLRATAC